MDTSDQGFKTRLSPCQLGLSHDQVTSEIPIKGLKTLNPTQSLLLWVQTPTSQNNLLKTPIKLLQKNLWNAPLLYDEFFSFHLWLQNLFFTLKQGEPMISFWGEGDQTNCWVLGQAQNVLSDFGREPTSDASNST